MALNDDALARWERGEPMRRTVGPRPVLRPATKPSDWLSIEEVAKILGVHRNTAYRWAQDAHFRAYRFGRTIRVRRGDIEQFVEGSVIEGGER